MNPVGGPKDWRGAERSWKMTGETAEGISNSVSIVLSSDTFPLPTGKRCGKRLLLASTEMFTMLLTNSLFSILLHLRALEQFHQLYQGSSSIDNQRKMEEMYVMGFRIISFLIECLPQHPEFEEAPQIEERSEQELVILRRCLNDLALRIDESVCNKVVDNELFLDSMIVSQMEKEEANEKQMKKYANNRAANIAKLEKGWTTADTNNVVRHESWVNFGDFNKVDQKSSSDNSARQKQRKQSGSPTADTVKTTGTGSSIDHDPKSISSISNSEKEESVQQKSEDDYSETSESTEEEREKIYYSDDDYVIRDDETEKDNLTYMDELDELVLLAETDDLTFMTGMSMQSYSSHPLELLKKSVSLDFLKTVSCEPVLYETDSEADDSWAPDDETDPNSRPCVPSSSGASPTADPARLAFRNIMSKIPHERILQQLATSSEQASEIFQQFTKAASSSSSSEQALEPVIHPLRHWAQSPSYPDTMEDLDSVGAPSVEDDCLDAVVEQEIEEYLQERKLERIARGKLDRKLGRGKLDDKLVKRRSRRRDPDQKASRSLGDSSSDRRARRRDGDHRTSRSVNEYKQSLSAKSFEERADHHTSRRDELVGSPPPPPPPRDDNPSPTLSLEEQVSSRSSDRNQQKPFKSINVSTRSRRKHKKEPSPFDPIPFDVPFDEVPFDEKPFDEKSLSSNNTLSTGSASDAYTSLSSLRRQTGSEHSAFSSYSGSTQRLIRPTPVAPVIEIKKKKMAAFPVIEIKPPPAPVIASVPEEWISLHDFNPDAYFGAVAEQDPRRALV